MISRTLSQSKVWRRLVVQPVSCRVRRQKTPQARPPAPASTPAPSPTSTTRWRRDPIQGEQHKLGQHRARDLQQVGPVHQARLPRDPPRPGRDEIRLANDVVGGHVGQEVVWVHRQGVFCNRADAWLDRVQRQRHLVAQIRREENDAWTAPLRRFFDFIFLQSSSNKYWLSAHKTYLESSTLYRP